MIHSIWNFLSDKTICGKPIEYEFPDGLVKGPTRNLKNISLELDDITCPECKSKAEVARK